MGQVDLESTLGGANANAASEKLADDDPRKDDAVSGEVPPDFPPESFWLSKDAEQDWFDRNAFFERKDSTRAGNSMNLNPHINPSSTSNSQRFSGNLKSKASMIGLPKSQKATFVSAKRRICKPANIKLFPKRPESSVEKTTATTPVEPGSPKVSCMGRVRSKRGRRRSNSRRRVDDVSGTGPEKQKTGFYSRVIGMFRSKKYHRKPSRSGSRKVAEEVRTEKPVPLWRSKSVAVKAPESDEPTAEPPGLGGLKRFASVRRAGSWNSDDFNEAVSAELDRRVDRS